MNSHSLNGMMYWYVSIHMNIEDCHNPKRVWCRDLMFTVFFCFDLISIFSYLSQSDQLKHHSTTICSGNRSTIYTFQHSPPLTHEVWLLHPQFMILSMLAHLSVTTVPMSQKCPHTSLNSKYMVLMGKRY